MGITYNLLTDIGKVRLLINDKADPFHFADAEIQVFLNFCNGILMPAAAMALESWAASVALNADSESIGDYSYTKKQVSNMLSLAQRYREEESTMPACGWAEIDMITQGEVESVDSIG